MSTKLRKRNPQKKPPKVQVKQPFLFHLQELRDRLLWYLASFAIASAIGYSIHSSIISFLTKPLGQTLYYSSPAGAFDFVLTISLFFGFLASLPVLIYHVLRFVEPAIPKNTKLGVAKFLAASCLLVVVGVVFAYFVSLPAALYFLSSFGSEEMASLISTSEYFSFVSRYMLGFGLLFQLPLVMVLVNSFYKLKIRTLFRYQKWVVLVSFILAAILTPTPDVFNQLIMAVPIILLYQVSIFVIWLINKHKKEAHSGISMQKP
ncbi:twin-arginine translocase subunit TatC [Aggregatilinea lenta]|uniref:twin-arginine translocase subunit TatC n=1 Tax=Aggregatilinea lenta TaxID=913108 RepID=UPI000E5A9386|nr:twin-arginine translocase subunit TatC [Aggregatilinea lenta]